MEQNKYAVYLMNDISNTESIRPLMILEPRAQKVIYTPYGSDWIKSLGYTYLPDYAEATQIVLFNKLPYIPYIPKRSKEEIISLISNIQQPIIQNIVDIDTTDIQNYEGQYGSIDEILPRLTQYIPQCQNFSNIALTEYNKNSKEYNLYTSASELLEDDEDTIIIGKNNDYVIVGSVSFQDIWDNLLNCGDNATNYYIIGSIKSGFGTYNGKKLGHSLVLVIDFTSRIVEIFDPSGITPGTRHVYFWVSKLIEFMNVKILGKKFRRIISADELYCPQLVGSTSSEFEGEQQCVIYAFYYILLRIINNKVSRDIILKYISSLSPVDNYNKIRKIAYLTVNPNINIKTIVVSI